MSKVHELKGLSIALASGQVDSIVAAFRKFDDGGSGSVAASHLDQVLGSLGLGAGASAALLAAARASEFYRDKAINYEDFAKWLCGAGPEAERMRGLLEGVCWSTGASVSLSPAVTKPEGLKLAGPTPCTGEDRVQYWEVGGPSRARVRVTVDEQSALKLGPEYTVAVRFRAGALAGESYDTLLMGQDGKHWLAVESVGRRLCCADGKHQKTSLLESAVVPMNQWVVAFLQPRGGGTAVFFSDAEGLLEVGTFDLNLAGSKLDKMGFAENGIHLADVKIWPKVLSWSDMDSALPRVPPPPPPSLPFAPRPRASFRGQVVDPAGKAVPDVKVKWSKKAALTDEDGCFEGSLSDAETDVPDETASVHSGGSTTSSCTVLSFSSEGYAPATARAQCTAGGAATTVRVTMRAVSATAVLDLAQGGSVVDEKTGSSITVPPGSLTYPDGSAVDGPVTVSLSVIDVTDPAALASMPGDFSAVGAEGKQVFLQSLGACWVGASDQEGRPLQVKEGSDGLGLDLKSTAKADMGKLDTTAEMWSFSEETGRWELETSSVMRVDGKITPNAALKAQPQVLQQQQRAFPAKKCKMRNKYADEPLENQDAVLPEEGCLSEEGFRSIIANDKEKTLSTNITKLGWINCDLAYHHPQRAVMLQGVVLDAARAPLVGVQLWSVGKDYNGRCPSVSKEKGKFGAMIAQFDSEVDVEVHLQRELTSDEKIHVYFENAREWYKHVDEATQKVMTAVAGKYRKNLGDALEWYPEQAGVKATVVWLNERRQWQHLVDGEVVFVRPAESSEGGPFGDSGWHLAPTFRTKKPIPAPIYSRLVVVDISTFGPFKTGPPGEFVDLGELVVK